MQKNSTFFDEYKTEMQAVQKEMPDLVRNFGSLFMTAMKDGALQTKFKELIALGIALADRCEPCIRLHVQKSLEAGCSKQEILEAAAIAVVMQGGPAYTHLPMVLQTIELCSKEDPITA